jgi:hypothetical protein
MVAPRAQFDAIEPLLAIQQLNAARLEYLRQVIAFNKAQFQLYTALGSPPEKALPGKTTIVDVPVSPVQAPLPKP